MAGDMYTYLAAKTPDYAGSMLTLTPSEVIVQKGRFASVTHQSDSGNSKTVYLSDTPIFEVSLHWKRITPAEADSVFDFYFDPLKAKGKGRSFIWQHASDGHTYVVKFLSDFGREYLPVRNNITELVLAVLGRIY